MKKYNEKITAYFISSPTFVSTSTIVINPGRQIEEGVNLIFGLQRGALNRAGKLIKIITVTLH